MGGTRRSTSSRDTRHLEEVPQLLIGQLDQQAGQKAAARFADARVAQGPRKRSREMADATGWILPDRRLGPSVEIHAPGPLAIEHVRMPEGLADVVQEHERLLAATG